MSQATEKREYDFSDRTKYDGLMEVVRNRMTVRAFDPAYTVPREHHEMILDAARHSPSGANAQPWHFIVVTDQGLKNSIMEYFREEQIVRAKLKMKFPTPDYRGLATARVHRHRQRFTRGEGVPGAETTVPSSTGCTRENAERILLAESGRQPHGPIMSAHLAAAELGYNVWWVHGDRQGKGASWR